MSYDKLDEPGSNMRIRLSSPVVRVEHEGAPDRTSGVRIAYRNGGKTVRGRAPAIASLACNNALIPALMPEIPGTPKRGAGLSGESAHDVHQCVCSGTGPRFRS